MNACIIGYGVVGKATALAFGIVEYYDLKESTIGLSDAKNFRYIFISLPTPTIDGNCFTDDIYNVVRTIKESPTTPSSSTHNIFIIRSTVWPGFADKLKSELGVKVVSNPEFLSEDTWQKDAKWPQMVVIGANDPIDAQEVKSLYMGRFKHLNPIMTDNVTAEFIKYVLNSFFSMKVIYANEIYDFAEKIGANYETVKKVLESHPWGTKNHLTIHYKGRRGVHGKCLQKDTEAFAKKSGSKILEAVIKINERFNQ